MVLSNISLAQTKFLHKLKLTLTHLKYLELLVNLEDVPNDKYHTDLSKSGIILDGAVTQFGKNIYEEFLQVTGDVDVCVKKLPKRKNEEFEKWWDSFPRNPMHGTYISTRSMRTSKDSCQTIFEKILAEGVHKTEDLIRVLELEVGIRKRESVTRGANQLEYMKGTEAYLNQRAFEDWFTYEKTKLNAVKRKQSFVI